MSRTKPMKEMATRMLETMKIDEDRFGGILGGSFPGTRSEAASSYPER